MSLDQQDGPAVRTSAVTRGAGMEAGRGFDGRWDGRAGAVMVVLMSLGAVELIRADSYQIQRCLNTGRYGAARAGRFGLGINCAVPVLKGESRFGLAVRR